MISSDRVKIPVLAQLIPEGIKPGTMFVAEVDPDSQWLALATTITARLLQAKSHVGYVCAVRSTADVKESLSALQVDVGEAIRTDLLGLDDNYSATLTGGRMETAGTQPSGPERTEDGILFHSLKVQDLSVEFLKSSRNTPKAARIFSDWPPGSLTLAESLSTLARFNEEKPLIEWMESRLYPEQRRTKRITIARLSRGVHTEWFYKRAEDFADGIIDVQLREDGEDIKSFLRVRSLKGQPHDARWHEIEIKPTGEAVLVV